MTHRTRTASILFLALSTGLILLGGRAHGPFDVLAAPSATTPYPILFVTQVPVPADFTTIGSVFGNHRGDIDSAPRGGDLWIRYPDATLKNLTQAAGYGQAGFQGAQSIAVREPAVHWSGTKAVFSMITGSTVQRYQWSDYYWQLYEIAGLGPSDTPVITKVPNQPASFNNVNPIYGTDGRIIFTSDRPRSGERHLYPLLDEYETAPSTTGLWSLDPATGGLFLMESSPSGAFRPIVDSFGRVVFSRWDHLQRDQQADADAVDGGDYGTFNYANETATATRLNTRAEIFPEPRSDRQDLLAGTNLAGNEFNQFFPWQVNEDGTEEETLNHVGRHELGEYFNLSLTDDPNLTEFIGDQTGRFNQNAIVNFLQIREDPLHPGLYFGVDAQEFQTHAAGQIVTLNGPLGLPADQMAVTYVTHRDTATVTGNPAPTHSGLYRNPLPLSDSSLLAVHTTETRQDANTGTRISPGSRYAFRIKLLARSGSYWIAGPSLTGGLSKSISYYDPDELVSYSGPFWELDPVEVRPSAIPPRVTPALGQPEQQVLTQESVSVGALQSYLTQNNLALIVSHNVTTRDAADRQQPFNLRVAGTNVKTLGATGKIYDVALMQFFQADQIRGLGGVTSPWQGRRVIAQVMRDPQGSNPPNASGVPGTVALGSDGSMAAFVPARRAMTWQLTDGVGNPVVRERYWLTFQPGEIRVCTSCHGLNSRDQSGQTAPQKDRKSVV